MADLSAARAAPISVLVVDDDPMVRAALVRMLVETPDIAIVAEADDGDTVAAQLDQHRTDVILMDLRMSRVDGVTATREARARPRPPEVLVLTTFESDDDIRSALSAGAAGYLVKDTPPDDLEAAIRNVHAGRPALSPSVTRHLMDTMTHGSSPSAESATHREALSQLTAQERAVALCIARGHSNARIARELHLSLGTVKTYTSNTLAKLHLDNRTQLALLVHHAGLTHD